jgi:hypothetical protein
MGIRTIQGFKDGNDDDRCAVLYCSTSGIAFGPLFKHASEADDFLQWCDNKRGGDVRDYIGDLPELLVEFRNEREAKRNARHEATGGKFGLRSPGSRYSFFGGWSVDGPAHWEHVDDAQTFATFADADAFRKEWPTLSSATVERLPL